MPPERFSAIPQEKTDTHQAGFLSELAAGAWSAVEQPIVGTEQLLGLDHGQAQALAAQAQNDSSLGFKLGQAAGGAAVLLGTAALAREIPGIGRAGSIVAGGGLGFLQPVNASEGLATRLEHAGIGAGVMTMFEFGPKAIGNAAGIPDSVLGGFARVGLTGAAAGAFDAQAQSLVDHHQLASWQDTLSTAGGFALGGMAFHGVGLGLNYARFGDFSPAREISGASRFAGAITRSPGTAALDRLAGPAMLESQAAPVAKFDGLTEQPVAASVAEKTAGKIAPADEKLAPGSKTIGFDRSGYLGAGDQGTVYDNGDGTVTKVFTNKETDVNAVRAMYERLGAIGVNVPEVLETGTTADGQPAMKMQMIGSGSNARDQVMLGELSPAERGQLKAQYYEMARTLQRHGLTVDWTLKNMVFQNGKLYLIDPSFIKEQPLSDGMIELFGRGLG